MNPEVISALEGFNPYRVFKFVATMAHVPRLGVWDASFNPYRVFKFVATLIWLIFPTSGLKVSIPIGFSSSLQPLTTKVASIRYPWFQSLSGFQVRCNQISAYWVGFNRFCFNPYRVFKFVATSSCNRGSIRPNRFQSLSGFQVRCNRTSVEGAIRRIYVFQSLSGFQVRCNFNIVVCIIANVFKVSIPIGFSSSLQRRWTPGAKSRYQVSIPIGFSSSLQRSGIRRALGTFHQFQSLSGFQVRCNIREMLQQYLSDIVSIPIGFSSSLQRGGADWCRPEGQGFNPYRVFKFVATHWI